MSVVLYVRHGFFLAALCVVFCSSVIYSVPCFVLSFSTGRYLLVRYFFISFVFLHVVIYFVLYVVRYFVIPSVV